MEWKSTLLIGLGGIGVALATGKAFRRLLLLPFEWLARKTESKVDDVIVSEASKDLGIDKPTIQEEAANAPISKE